MTFAIVDRRFEGVEFGDQILAFMSNKPEVLWKLIKKYEEVGLHGTRDFTVYAGMQMIEKCGPEMMLKFLGRNELKDKDLTQRLENEAKHRMERR